jgi:hypothetical protein
VGSSGARAQKQQQRVLQLQRARSAAQQAQQRV